MEILFELSKEYKDLPKDEIISCLNAEKISYNIIESNENVLIIDSNIKYNLIKDIANRLSYTYHVDKLLFSCNNSLNEIKKLAKENIIKKKGSIAINYKKRSTSINSQSIIKALAEIYTKDRIVDLINPDIEIRVVISDKKIYIGEKIIDIDRKQFESRKVQNRPFFSPISLHPKIARALVNISMIKPNETLLDPFCGTGGIILEAGFIGAKVIGSDIEEKMIQGCMKTFEFYNIKNYKLFSSDVGNIDKIIKNSVDAIVTDMPYGKSTTTKGEDISILYNRAFESINKLIKKDGFIIIGFSNPDMISIGKKYFKLIKTYEFKVHRSLTRYFAVYKN